MLYLHGVQRVAHSNTADACKAIRRTREQQEVALSALRAYPSQGTEEGASGKPLPCPSPPPQVTSGLFLSASFVLQVRN